MLDIKALCVSAKQASYNLGGMAEDKKNKILMHKYFGNLYMSEIGRTFLLTTVIVNYKFSYRERIWVCMSGCR